jgi:Mn-dependent DtxR family transcriptional regulator
MPRWNNVLVGINNSMDQYSYCQRLSRQVKGSLTYLREIVKLLEENDLVEVIPSRKIKRLVLTEKGKKVTVSILNIKSELRCL